MSDNKKLSAFIMHELFAALCVLLVIFSVMELVKPKMVSGHFPLGYFAAGVVVYSIGVVVLQYGNSRN